MPTGPCPYCGVVDDVCSCASLLAHGAMVTAFIDDDDVPTVERSLLRGPVVSSWSLTRVLDVIAAGVVRANGWLLNIPRP